MYARLTQATEDFLIAASAQGKLFRRIERIQRGKKFRQANRKPEVTFKQISPLVKECTCNLFFCGCNKASWVAKEVEVNKSIFIALNGE